VHGQQGEVVGPAVLEGHKGKGLAMRFPGNKGYITCLIDQVRRLRAAAAANPTPAPHTSDVPATALPRPKPSLHGQPSLHEQPLAPQPTA